jgi:hypothetical protein
MTLPVLSLFCLYAGYVYMYLYVIKYLRTESKDDSSESKRESILRTLSNFARNSYS